jgi:hypothetical protein
MASRPLCALVALAGATACYTPPDSLPSVRTGALESTVLLLQAVDAGTGAVLSDAEMTVRYLIRSPIVFDASSVDKVPTVEPYEISHRVDQDSLVVEVRFEADSYYRLDTVLSVPRGASAGPMTMRLARRLERTADRPTTVPTPEPEQPTGVASGDRRAMQAGDRAFNREQWFEATEAYQTMPAPDDEMSEYGRAFRDARLRQGIAHINRAEFGRALELFEEVIDMEDPSAEAYLRLTEAQCAVGRTEEGLGTLAQVGRLRSRMDPVEQSYVSAMMAYRRGVCSMGSFERAQTTRERVQAGAQATRELNAFIEGARAMSPVPPEVYDAVLDAERRVEVIRRRAMGD